jgi:hypothetical protein
MSNAFMGQRQQASPMGFGGFGGFGPQPFSPFSGGYGGGMGGFGAAHGGGYHMGYGGSPLLPPPQPTVNDLFSQYFSQQYYGGPAFNPFAATSFFGGGYGGGFGFGGGGRRGRGGRMRPQPMPAQDDMMYAGGSPGFYKNQPYASNTIGAPPPSLSQLFASEFGPMQYTGPQDQLMAQPAVMPQQSMVYDHQARYTPVPERVPPPPGYHYELGGSGPILTPDSTVFPADTGPMAATGTQLPTPQLGTGPNALLAAAVMPQAGTQPYAAPPPVSMPSKFAEPLMPAVPSQLPSFGNFETMMPIPIPEPPVYAAPASFGPFGRGMARGGFR